MNVFVDALKAMWQRRMLLLVQLVGHPVLLLLVWWWLGLPDEKVWQVALSAIAALVILAFAGWLHGVALAAYREAAGVPWGGAWKRAPLVALWVAAFGALIWLAFWFVPESKTWLLALAVGLLAVALLPLGSRLASRVPGLGCIYADWRYYTGTVVTALIGGVGPALLMSWMPKVEGLEKEIISFALRLAVACVLALLASLWLAALIGRLAQAGGQAVTQPAENSPEPALGD